MTDRDRPLGVIEALVAARDQCPNGAVRRCAEAALEALKRREPGIVREQAYLVLSASQGWRGDRADQVRRALRDYVAEAADPGDA